MSTVDADTDKDTVSGDGRCGIRGRLAMGMMHRSYINDPGSFNIVAPGGTIERFETGRSIPNGMDFSPDEKTLYVCGSLSPAYGPMSMIRTPGTPTPDAGSLYRVTDLCTRGVLPHPFG